MQSSGYYQHKPDFSNTNNLIGSRELQHDSNCLSKKRLSIICHTMLIFMELFLMDIWCFEMEFFISDWIAAGGASVFLPTSFHPQLLNQALNPQFSAFSPDVDPRWAPVPFSTLIFNQLLRKHSQQEPQSRCPQWLTCMDLFHSIWNTTSPHLLLHRTCILRLFWGIQIKWELRC